LLNKVQHKDPAGMFFALMLWWFTLVRWIKFDTEYHRASVVVARNQGHRHSHGDQRGHAPPKNV